TRDGAPTDSRVPLRPMIVTPRAVPPATSRVAAEWPGLGALIGYDAPNDLTEARRDCAAVTDGCDTALILHWRAAGPTVAPYVVFVHLRDTAGRIVAQHDGEPRDGLWPTDSWLSGHTVLDPRPLATWERLPAGDYTMVVGWYRRDTGARLPLADGATEAVIGRLRR
ncbi:MAG: hypothetical protein NZ518_05615, partial [Dehalococcoidia bacterium]|nr:hypothetical protein [Dehalococcoidia bacterium]